MITIHFSLEFLWKEKQERFRYIVRVRECMHGNANGAHYEFRKYYLRLTLLQLTHARARRLETGSRRSRGQGW
jgi:hypothetical protein